MQQILRNAGENPRNDAASSYSDPIRIESFTL